MAEQKEILSRLEKESYVELKGEEWEALLAEAELVREEKPVLAEAIRLLRIDGTTVVQETSDRREILLRRFEDDAEADAFIRERLETYDRMWDGCGCRIDYYGQKECGGDPPE